MANNFVTFEPKFVASRVSNKNFHSGESKAFSKSIKRNMPRRSFFWYNSITSEISRTFSLSSVPIVSCSVLYRMQLFFIQKLVTFGEILQGFATLEDLTFLTLRCSEYKKTNNLTPMYACTCNTQKFLHYNNHHNLPTLLYINFVSHYKHSYTNSPSVTTEVLLT